MRLYLRVLNELFSKLINEKEDFLDVGRHPYMRFCVDIM